MYLFSGACLSVIMDLSTDLVNFTTCIFICLYTAYGGLYAVAYSGIIQLVLSQVLVSAMSAVLDKQNPSIRHLYRQGRQFLSRSGGDESGKFTIIRGLFSGLVPYHLI